MRPTSGAAGAPTSVGGRSEGGRRSCSRPASRVWLLAGSQSRARRYRVCGVIARPATSRKPQPETSVKALQESGNAGRMIAPREGHPTLQRPHRPARRPSPLSASWPATCAGPGTRRLATCSSGIDPERWEKVRKDPVRLLSALSARELADLAGDAEFVVRGARTPRPTSTATSPSPAGTRPGPSRSRAAPRGDRLLQPGVRHHRGAAAVLRRPRHPRRRPPQDAPPTSACRSSASACSTRPATSSRRSTATAGSRRPTPSSTPTACR